MNVQSAASKLTNTVVEKLHVQLSIVYLVNSDAKIRVRLGLRLELGLRLGLR